MAGGGGAPRGRGGKSEERRGRDVFHQGASIKSTDPHGIQEIPHRARGGGIIRNFIRLLPTFPTSATPPTAGASQTKKKEEEEGESCVITTSHTQGVQNGHQRIVSSLGFN